ncbi:IS3 family transposase [Spirosoma pollinicola]|uniref:IS3 family transposase n=1 Tax=Spirosoma pollinicola TaxID=2057025 RepID=UPI0012FE16D7|nr:IS3 family transposase [Spirosoma pollinicola]
MSHPHIRLRRIGGLFGFSRQAYYQHTHRLITGEEADKQVLELVEKVRTDHPRIGGKKLYDLIKAGMLERGIKMGRDALFDLLAANGLLIRKRRRKMITTFSRHRFRKYPNLIKNLTILRPNQVWVADITYWLTEAGYLYISFITDAYSRRIMGFAVAASLEAVHSRRALEMALKQITKRMGPDLIHHSDRGIQYCCDEYTQAVDTYHIRISMTENSDPLENSIAERINGIMKQEYLSQQPVRSLEEAYTLLENGVFLYNYKRPHLSCNMLSPDVAHNGHGPLERRWKNYYKPPTSGEKK